MKTIKDFKILGKDRIPYVAWEEIEEKLGKEEYKRFFKWIAGQTVIEEGVYPCDLERFLNNLPVID